MTLPSYLKEDSDSKKGRKQETKAMKTINSGTLVFDPRDLKVTTTDEDYLVDTKLVTKQTCFQLKLDDIQKFHKQAKLRTPVYLIYLGEYVVKAIIQKVK